MEYKKCERTSKIMVMVSGILLLLLFVGALALCTSVANRSNRAMSAAAALEELQNSIEYSDSDIEISFQVPSDYPAEDWNIIIAGRIEMEDVGGMSVHFFQEENSTHSWLAGKRYVISMRDSNYTDLLMVASLPDQNGDTTSIDVDLLKLAKSSIMIRKSYSMQIPDNLLNYRYREEDADNFTLWNNDVNIGGMERLSEDSLYELNHASLISEEELSGFPVPAVKRLYERDYPAASGRTDTYEQLRIGLLYNNSWYDFWLDLRYGSDNDLLQLVKSVQFYVDSAEEPIPGLKQEEIDYKAE
ncbi:hypothetical protein Ami103574_09645 [Aminipila butyrica]|uniref:Uncharacterized protein n=1 Tax=Aminipila butyrica TaxID=433296 RepID=A0A858BWU2_9FIRM|nr:hypothetical protein [Aminipila butyrica]QIB69578.1 hypothetical protein Ami103574_09645 [Aminipila butyrica]